MITGIGIDVVQNERIRDSIQKFGDRFLNRIYTEGEKEYCKNSADPAIHFAARWAAKEAAFKALGTGWSGGVKWRDVEVERLPTGKPELRLYGEALSVATRAGATRFFVSLSHDQSVSCAVVVLETAV
jgi:holo-[acyl-carrier protein] synthase